VKKVLLIFMTFTAMFLSIAGGRQDDGIQIGVSMASLNDTFLMQVKAGMEESVTVRENVSAVYVDAGEDSEKQLSHIEGLIAQGLDVIIVIPVDTSATKLLTEACLTADIPLVYVNRKPDFVPEGVHFVGSRSVDAGIIQMEYLAEKMGGKGNIVIMMGKLDNEAAVKRTKGVEKIVSDYPDINITGKQTGEWLRVQGKTLMENWLSSGDEINAIAANNDEMALGAIEALEISGKTGQIIVGGVDGTPEALHQMSLGKLDVTVFQDAGAQGSVAIDAACELAGGNAVERELWIPFQLVTPDNYKNFYSKY